MTELASWEARFRARRIGLPRSARDRQSRTCLTATTAAGTVELHTWAIGDASPLQATHRAEGTSYGGLDPLGEYLWWFDDRRGDELGIWRRQPFAGGAAEDPTGLPAAYTCGLALGTSVAVIGCSDDAGVRIYASTGSDNRLIYQHAEEAFVGGLSRDDSLLVIGHSEHGDSRHPALRVIRVADGDMVAELHDGPGLGLESLSFSPLLGDNRLLIQHERFGAPALLIWEPQSGTEQLIDLDQPGEVADADWTADGTGLIVAMSFQARTRLLQYSLTTGECIPFGPEFGTVTSFAVQDDGHIWGSWSSAARPPSIRRLSVGESGLGQELLTAPGPAAPDSVPIEDLWVAGPTGEVHALLRRPPTPGPHPVILEIHGGPTAHDIDAFSAYPSAWVDHGFAVVQINYRGSTGYGTAWRDALEDRVGHTELADILAVRDHLVRSGMVDPQRIILAGASWGGYLTLLGLGVYPSSWTLGLAGVPVADYIAAYEDEMEGLKAFDRSLFGGSPQEVPEKYRDSSPLTYVADVVAPVLILAGENDPRCPIRQIANYTAALAERHHPHQVYRYDAGHGSLVNDERVRQMQVELDFVKQYLG